MEFLKICALKLDKFIIYDQQILSKDIEEFKCSSDIILISENENLNTIKIDNAGYTHKSNIYISEWKTYKIEITDSSTSFKESDFTNKGSFITNKVGLIQLRNCIGLAQFKDKLFFVESEKISMEQFQNIVDYINSFILSLSFDFNKETNSIIERDNSQKTDLLYHVFQILYYWLGTTDKSKNIFNLLNVISKNPHRTIYDNTYYENINGLNYVDEETILDIMAAPGKLIYADNVQNKLAYKFEKGGKRYLPETILLTETIDTFDNHENRLIKFFINECLNTLNIFIEEFKKQKDKIIDQSLIANTIDYKNKLNSILNDTFFRNVGILTYIPHNSQVLQRKDGYRAIYKYYLLLKALPKIDLNPDDFKNIIENKGIDVLYEYFCFFSIASILSELYNINSKELIFKSEEDKFRKLLSKKINYFEYSDRNGIYPNIKLYYNKTYSAPETYSKSFKPDISLEIFDNNKQVKNILLLDAKFKFDQNELTEERDVKKSDIATMHSYKDAIVKASYVLVLYPGDNSKLFIDPTSGYGGIGALPLNAGKDGDRVRIKEFLNKLILEKETV